MAAVYKNGVFWGLSPVGSFTTGNVTYSTTQDIGTTLLLSWNNFAWATSYSLQYRKVGNPSWIGSSASSNSIKLSNLVADADYECKVSVFKNAQWGTCQTGTFHTGKVQFSTSQDIGTTLQLAWTTFNGTATSYVVQYRPNGTSTWLGAPSTANPMKLINLLPETIYEAQVKVYVNNTAWGISNIGTFTSGKVDFTMITDNGTSMEIGWTSFAPWATSYTLQYSLPAMTNWLYATTTSTTSTTVSPVLSAQDYFVRLRVFVGSTLWGVSKEAKIGRSTPPAKGFTAVTDDVSTGLNVYPNPFVEQINLEISAEESSNCTWSIYDITGKLILSGNQSIEIGRNTLNIDATDLSKGVYMLNAFLNNEKHSFRIVRQ
jgi:hypothetical protein